MDAETEQRAVNSIWDRVAELQRKKDEAEAERLGISYEKVRAMRLLQRRLWDTMESHISSGPPYQSFEEVLSFEDVAQACEKVAARCREFHAARGEPETIKPPRPAAQT